MIFKKNPELLDLQISVPGIRRKKWILKVLKTTYIWNSTFCCFFLFLWPRSPRDPPRPPIPACSYSLDTPSNSLSTIRPLILCPCLLHITDFVKIPSFVVKITLLVSNLSFSGVLPGFANKQKYNKLSLINRTSHKIYWITIIFLKNQRKKNLGLCPDKKNPSRFDSYNLN